MKKLYNKSEILFAVSFIVIYIAGSSVCESISKSAVLVFHALFSGVVLYFIKRNNLFEKYGIKKPEEKSSHFLFYIPLALIVCTNLYGGLIFSSVSRETLAAAFSMLFVGFLEEVIFRGFLFKAMAKDNEKVALIVSSLTFGIGHIINLIYGTGDLVPTLCQVLYATAVGLLFTVIFIKGKSLIPCIITHSLVNALDVFSARTLTGTETVVVSLFICVVAVGYSWYLNKKCDKPTV